MVHENLIGFIAGALVCSSFISQIVRVVKLKRAHENSPLFTSLMLVGCIIGTAYGFSLKLLTTMVFSVIHTTQVTLLIVLRYMYSRTPKKVSNQVTGDVNYTTILEANQQWLEETQPKIDKILN